MIKTLQQEGGGTKDLGEIKADGGPFAYKMGTLFSKKLQGARRGRGVGL